MRHRKRGRKLGRKTGPRHALRRHVVCALFTHGRITTTLAKGKEFRPWAEKLITIAKKGAAAREAGDEIGALNAYRRLIQELHDKDVAGHLMHVVGPSFADRPGGYTRLLRVAKGRLGDNAPTVVFELVNYDPAGDEVEAPVETEEEAPASA